MLHIYAVDSCTDRERFLRAYVPTSMTEWGSAPIPPLGLPSASAVSSLIDKLPSSFHRRLRFHLDQNGILLSGPHALSPKRSIRNITDSREIREIEVMLKLPGLK